MVAWSGGFVGEYLNWWNAIGRSVGEFPYGIEHVKLYPGIHTVPVATPFPANTEACFVLHQWPFEKLPEAWVSGDRKFLEIYLVWPDVVIDPSEPWYEQPWYDAYSESPELMLQVVPYDIARASDFPMMRGVLGSIILPANGLTYPYGAFVMQGQQIAPRTPWADARVTSFSLKNIDYYIEQKYQARGPGVYSINLPLDGTDIAQVNPSAMLIRMSGSSGVSLPIGDVSVVSTQEPDTEQVTMVVTQKTGTAAPVYHLSPNALRVPVGTTFELWGAYSRSFGSNELYCGGQLITAARQDLSDPTTTQEITTARMDGQGSFGFRIEASALPRTVGFYFTGVQAIYSLVIEWYDPASRLTEPLPEEFGIAMCPLPQGQITPLTSRVENPQLSHIHTATDFQSAGGASGCGPCGASAGAGGGITTELRIDRIHRYADFTRPGSFGPGVFSNLDIQLTLWNHGEAGEIWDPSAASPIPLTRTGVGACADQKRSAIAGLRLLAADGTTQVDADDAVTAVATQHDGTQWVFEVVQAGLGGDADRQGRLIAIRDRAGNALSITYAFPASASDADLGNARARLLEMAAVTDQRGRTVTFAYGWTCGQPVVTSLIYPTGDTVVYHYDGDIAGVCRIDYPDGTRSTFGLRDDPASQCMVVDYQDAGAEGTHRTKSVYLTKTAFTQADGTVVQQSPNRVRRVVGPTGEPTYLNWLERDGSQVKIYVYEGGGIGGTGRVYRLDTTEGVTDATYVATAWSFATAPSTWTWEKVADYRADGLLRMGKQTDPRGVATVYDRDPASGAITGRTNIAADGSTLSAEKTLYNGMRQPTFHQDANGIITRSTYDEDGNLRFRTEGIVLAEDGVTEDDSNATTWEWQYRADGQVLAEIDPLGRRTDYEYDPRGFRNAEVSPPDDPALPTVRARKEWHYDAAGRMDWSKDASGHVTNYDYDTRNRIWRIRYGNNTAETFEFGTGADANLLKARTDRDGMRTTFIYDPAGREISRTEGAQKPTEAITTTTTYLEGTDLPATVVRGGQRTDTIYDTRKRVHEVRRWVDGQRYLSDWTVYDDADRVAYTIDAHGRRTYSVYDDLGRVTRTIREATPGAVPADADLQTLARDGADNPAYVIDETAYDAGGRVLTTTDARGVVTKLGYDNLGRLIDRWEAYGTLDVAHWHWAYDAVGNRLLERDPLGRETRFAYTGRNLLQSQTVAEGTDDEAVTAFTYTPTGQRHTQTDPNQHTTTWYYGACCDWLEKVVDAAGFATTYTYTGGGLVQTILDASNHLTVQGYDGRKRSSTSTNGDQETTTTAYDDDLTDLVGLSGTYATAFAVIGDRVGHQAVAVTNHLNESTVRVTDGLGRVVLQIDPAGHLTRTRYDEQVTIDGVVLVQTVQTNPLGHDTILRYDGLGRMRQQVVQDPDDQVTSIAYDAAGNRRRVTDPEGHAMSWTYDARNRQSTATDAAGYTTGTEYDAMGNVLVLRDGRGKETRCTYSARNQKQTETDRLGKTTRFTYDPAGNLLTISDADNEARKATVTPDVYVLGMTRYTYTARNQLETERFPGETAARSYTYYPNGQLWTRTDQRGIVTTYTYDGANRLTGRAYSDAPADVFVLDDAGRMRTATSGRYGTVVERTWNHTGTIATETTTWPGEAGGGSTLVQYGYDDANRPTDLILPDGNAIGRTYTRRNAMESLSLAGATLAQAVYDNAGRRASLTYGNGLSDSRTYTPDNRLESTVVAAAAPAAPVVSLGYQYDANRRKTDETDSLANARSQRFDYDDADRLTAWIAGPKAQSWTLSNVGDWNQTTRDGVTEDRTHSPVHAIATVNGAQVLHDAAGNLARTAGGQGFSWDAENRLLMADALPSDDYKLGQVQYWYDALGRRLAKKVHGSVTRFVHDGWQVVQELEAPYVATEAEAASDGPLDSLATVPDGALLYPVYDEDGTRHNPLRVNVQPETVAIPDGFIADKGRAYATRTNGLTYGWLDTTDRPSHTVRRFHPLPQYDTVGAVADGSTTWTWQIALHNGTYPVAIVAGDATSLAHTNNLAVNGQVLTDPDPGDDTTEPAYERGDFDGWLVPVQVTDGILTITAGAGAFNPTLCFLEIGAKGQPITADMQTRLADQILAATKRTGGSPFWNGGTTETRSYVWDPAYIDHLIAYQHTNESGTQTYYAHSGAQYSVQAVTDAAGNVVERYSYDAYGERTVEGSGNGRSSIGLTTAYTGRALDEETGLYYFRNRMYSGKDGRFVSRDPMGYVDGASLYGAYFVPSLVDPSGTELMNRGKYDQVMQKVKELAKRQEVEDVRKTGKEIGWVIYGNENLLSVSKQISGGDTRINLTAQTIADFANPVAFVHVHPSAGGGSRPLSPEDILANAELSSRGLSSIIAAISLGDNSLVQQCDRWVTMVEFDTAEVGLLDEVKNGFDITKSVFSGRDMAFYSMNHYDKMGGIPYAGSYFEGAIAKAKQLKYSEYFMEFAGTNGIERRDTDMLVGLAQYEGLRAGLGSLSRGEGGKRVYRLDSFKVSLP